MNRPNEAHHIVVIGREADSFVLAARLGHKLGRDGKALVTFVDQSMTTRWSPFLYEVEGGAFNEGPGNAARAMPKTAHPFQLRLGRIDSIDRLKKEITLALVADDWGRELIPARRLDYDTLILESSQNLYEVVR
jgi:NADH dehydrogenase